MNTHRFKLFALLTGIAGLLIIGACALWVQSQQQQYARNRQLIQALMRDDVTTQAYLPLPVDKSVILRLPLEIGQRRQSKNPALSFSN